MNNYVYNEYELGCGGMRAEYTNKSFGYGRCCGCSKSNYYIVKGIVEVDKLGGGCGCNNNFVPLQNTGNTIPINNYPQMMPINNGCDCCCGGFDNGFKPSNNGCGCNCGFNNGFNPSNHNGCGLFNALCLLKLCR